MKSILFNFTNEDSGAPRAARDGKTYFMKDFNLDSWNQHLIKYPHLVCTLEELLDMFRKEFPGCTITYVDETINGTLKKCIKVDWSLEPVQNEYGWPF